MGGMGIEMYSCDPSMWEAEDEESRFSQSGLLSKTSQRERRENV